MSEGPASVPKNSDFGTRYLEKKLSTIEEE